MTKDELNMIAGIWQNTANFRRQKDRDAKDDARWAEKQLLEEAMHTREEKWRSEQLALQKAMQERQIRRMDEDSERWRATFDRDNNRYLDGIINQSVKDKIESDRHAEQAAARADAARAAQQQSAHGQKMDLSKLDLAMIEHELRKQQHADRNTGNMQFSIDPDGNLGLTGMTLGVYGNNRSLHGPEAAKAAAQATQAVGPSTQTSAAPPPAAAAPSAPASPPPAKPAAPVTDSPDLQPNPKTASGGSFWRDFGNGAWNTTKWLAGANIVPALANSSAGKAVRKQYNEAKEDRAYHAAIQAADRAKPKPAPENNYAMQQVKDFANMWIDPFKPAARKTLSTVKQRYKETKAEREQQRAAQLEAEERELRRRAERLDALNQGLY